MTCAKSRASGRFYRVRLPDVQLLVPQHLTLQCSEGDATQLKEGIRDRGQNYKEACERFKWCGRVRYPLQALQPAVRDQSKYCEERGGEHIRK